MCGGSCFSFVCQEKIKTRSEGCVRLHGSLSTGGGLVGMALGLLMNPAAFLENYVTILIITVPAIAFIYLIITRPQILLVDNLFFQTHNDHYSVAHKYNAAKNSRQKEIDKVLDKISRTGMDSPVPTPSYQRYHKNTYPLLVTYFVR